MDELGIKPGAGLRALGILAIIGLYIACFAVLKTVVFKVHYEDLETGSWFLSGGVAILLTGLILMMLSFARDALRWVLFG